MCRNKIWRRLDTSLTLQQAIRKPCLGDAICLKEKYIQAKYAEKMLVNRETRIANKCPAKNLWEAVKSNNLKDAYRLIVQSEADIINTIYAEVSAADDHDTAAQDPRINPTAKGPDNSEPPICCIIVDSMETQGRFQGGSLLHLASQIGNQVMLELLLQFRANVNLRDFSGRTPLHVCISQGKNTLAKFLLRRGANPSIRDAAGMSVLDRAMEMGSITDEELFILLSEC
uniref:Uncharacterized protein n=2 Tax=Kalanchoe fedtschenkoi TaxID=63787 RepID=A0A7N0UJC9_KALFE